MTATTRSGERDRDQIERIEEIASALEGMSQALDTMSMILCDITIDLGLAAGNETLTRLFGTKEESA